jgi:hypothetical protein
MKGSSTNYPLPYNIWKKKPDASLEDTLTWTSVEKKLICSEYEANPLRSYTDRWSILPKGDFSLYRILNNQDKSVQGRKGIVTDLNGCYFIELLGRGRLPNTVRFTNHPAEGRREVPPITDEIEIELIYPLIKGAANIRPFFATTSSLYVIIPNRQITVTSILNADEFADKYPNTYRYFDTINRHDTLLETRSTWRTRMRPLYDTLVALGRLHSKEIPFYAIYDIGDYSFAPYKVVWPEMTGSIKAAVISDEIVPFGGGRKPIIPDHKVYFAPFDNPEHAHYVCAFLNSSTIRTYISSFSIPIQMGTIFRHLSLPSYSASNELHRNMSQHSIEAHRILDSTDGNGNIDNHVNAIDNLANEILDIDKPYL